MEPAMPDRAVILIVEDESASLDGLAELLEDEGYATLKAHNGLEGLAIFAHERVDLILSDVRMPHLDGLEMIARLRQSPMGQDVPIILLSAHGHTPDRVVGLDHGADDYIGKPIEPDELLARVRAHLRRSSRSRELVLESHVDPLTSVLNRRGIDEVLDMELARSGRTGQPVSVVMVDVNDFKHINDAFGHIRGDEVLRRVARALADNIRASDRVGRYGGDEFLIVAPDTPADQALHLIDRLRLATLSTPCAFGTGRSSPGESAEALVSHADVAMYEDKHQRKHPR
jgi:diguanylate cyclase (GGDEF)-like protein